MVAAAHSKWDKYILQRAVLSLTSLVVRIPTTPLLQSSQPGSISPILLGLTPLHWQCRYNQIILLTQTWGANQLKDWVNNRIQSLYTNHKGWKMGTNRCSYRGAYNSNSMQCVTSHLAVHFTLHLTQSHISNFSQERMIGKRIYTMLNATINLHLTVKRENQGDFNFMLIIGTNSNKVIYYIYQLSYHHFLLNNIRHYWLCAHS